LTLRDLADRRRITATGGISSSAAIVHHILHSETARTRAMGGPVPGQHQTRMLRAILRIAHGVEVAWARLSHPRR